MICDNTWLLSIIHLRWALYRRHKCSKAAKLTIWSGPVMHIFLAALLCPLHTFSYRKKYAVRFLLDITTPAATPISLHASHYIRFINCTPQMLKSTSVWIPDPASIRTLASIKESLLGPTPRFLFEPQPLFELRFYADNYGAVMLTKFIVPTFTCGQLIQ